MKNIIVVCLLFFGVVSGSQAQDRSVFTQYYINPVLVNPGYTGFENHHSLFFNHRTKWAAFPGAPKSYMFSYDGPVGDRLGLGGMLFAEKFGSLNKYRGMLSYAYKIPLSNELDISAGLTTELHQYILSNGTVTDPLFQPGDVYIDEGIDGLLFFNSSFGVYGDYMDKFFFGFSFPEFIRSRLDDIVVGEEVDNPFNYTVLLGYRFDVEDYNFSVEPSVFFRKFRHVPFMVDFNAKFEFLDNKLIGGLTYSFGGGDRFGALLGTRIDNFHIYYSYDVYFGEFQSYDNGSHEVTVGFTIPGK